MPAPKDKKKFLLWAYPSTLELVKNNYRKDESLLGGMQIKIKDTVIDLSIKSKLENFKRM